MGSAASHTAEDVAPIHIPFFLDFGGKQFTSALNLECKFDIP